MKNTFIKITTLIFCLFVTTSLVSCDDGGDLDPGATSTVEMSGDWYVKTFVGENQVLDYALITTYNTADNDGKSMWVDDNKHIWNFKAKTPVDVGNLTFAGNALESKVEGYNITVTISNGKITKKGTKASGSNSVVDEISFNAEFSDDPGTIYTIKGYKRTGFLEDEH